MIFNKDKKNSEDRVNQLGILAGIILVIIIVFQIIYPDVKSREEIAAEGYMREMLESVSSYCIHHDIPIDTITDPSGTGLIGPEWSEIATTIGHLEAKRTSIQPEFAGLMTELFTELGLKRGDTIALGSSGSFPGLLLACLSAAKAMNLKTKTILSIGASSFGATRPELNILTIYNIIYSNGLLEDLPLAVSLGGENDTGDGWDEHILDQLNQEIAGFGDWGIRRSGDQKIGRSLDHEIRFIKDEVLSESVREREKIYGMEPGCGIKVFVNAGGAMANIGTSPSILKMKPGIVRNFKIPEPEQQGVIHRALEYGIPVIHLLNLKGLAMEYGLKWDPVVPGSENG